MPHRVCLLRCRSLQPRLPLLLMLTASSVGDQKASRCWGPQQLLPPYCWQLQLKVSRQEQTMPPLQDAARHRHDYQPQKVQQNLQQQQPLLQQVLIWCCSALPAPWLEAQTAVLLARLLTAATALLPSLLSWSENDDAAGQSS